MMVSQEPHSASGRTIVDLSLEGGPASRLGSKAAALWRALSSGAKVPRAWVVPTTLEGEIAQVERELLPKLGGGLFAVRSSACAEDGAQRSFAGQLESELHVPRERVLAAVERCWRSAHALRAVRYGASAGKVAVIVQEMVQADCAGVAFSADPRSGERGVVVIEAVLGTGDRLVSGEVTPEAWRLCAGKEPERRGPGGVLHEDQARRVAALCREMERVFGAPQDIEWALAGDALWLLQSRPITALPAAPRPIPQEIPSGSWERDDHHGVLSPLGWAWFQPYGPAMAAAMRKAGLPLKTMEPTRVGGHLYARMVMEGPESSKLPPRWVLWLASRLAPSMRRGNRLAAEMLDQERYMEVVTRWSEEWRPELHSRIDQLFLADPSPLSTEELLDRIKACLDLTKRGLELHAELGGPSFFGVGKLGLFLEDELGWQPARAFELLAGASPKTTELSRQIERIVHAHRDELARAGGFPHSWAALCASCPGLGQSLSAWLEENRLRQLHYDPKHPSLGERPDYVLSIASAIAHDLDKAPESPPADAEALLAQAKQALTDDKRRELERLLAQAHAGYGLRDENGVDTVSRPAGLLRHFVLELGRRLEPVLSAAEHAVYLYPEEHGPALRGELPDLRERVEQRRGEESWAHLNRGPRRLGPEPPPMPPADVFPRGLARMMRAMGWMMQSEAPVEAKGDHDLVGVGVGHRVVEGRARVIDHPHELAKLKHGEILVCRITSPEWSIGLGRVAAIVTNEGGALSHPAIIAREFGVPAVLGVEHATQRIRSGDGLRVDPIAGRVEILGGTTS